MSDTTKTGTVITLKMATQCQKELKAATTKDDVIAWMAKYKDTVGYRRLGQLAVYNQSPRKLVTG